MEEDLNLQEQQTEQLSLLRELCEIPAPSLHEEARSRFVYDWLETMVKDEGAEALCRVRLEPSGNVSLLIPGKTDRVRIFSAHLDTVFPDTEPMELREDDAKLYCPGVGDDSANLVNLLFAARHFIRRCVSEQWVPPVSLLFAASVGEEGFGNLRGSRALYETYGERTLSFTTFDLYIPQCTGTAVGSYRCRIRVRTKGGHSYHDFGSPNAIELLCRIVEMLYHIELPTKAKTTCNVGRISGGTSVNTIAAEAACLYEYRSESGTCMEIMRQRFEDVMKKAQDLPGEISVEVLGIRPANAADEDREALQRFVARNGACVKEATGEEPSNEPISSDANIFLADGIPSVTLGTIRGGGAHTRGEWIEKGSLTAGLALAIRVVEAQCEEKEK